MRTHSNKIKLFVALVVLLVIPVANGFMKTQDLVGAWAWVFALIVTSPLQIIAELAVITSPPGTEGASPEMRLRAAANLAFTAAWAWSAVFLWDQMPWARKGKAIPNTAVVMQSESSGNKERVVAGDSQD